MIATIPIALNEYGVTETLQGDTPRILQYAKEAGIANINNDEISWCSIFVNWVCKQAGLEMSHSPAARSWLTIGEDTKDPEMGDVVVLWRVSPTDWRGHVGFYINHSEDGQWIYLLSGNQGNRVCIQTFSINQILSYRKLKVI